MDGLAFIASIFKSLAWPTVAITVGWYYRLDIRELIESVVSLKLGGGEFIFERRLTRAEGIVLPTPTNAVSAPVRNVFTPENASHASPEERIKHAWYRVRHILWDVARKSAIPSGSELKPSGTIRWLGSRRIIDTSTAELLRELKRLRDEAGLYPTTLVIDSEQAERFEQLATRAIETLEAIKH